MTSDSIIRYSRYARCSSCCEPSSLDKQLAEIERSKLAFDSKTWIHVADCRETGAGSGANTGLSQLMEDVRSGRLKIDVILVVSLERIGRGQEAQRLLHTLQTEYGVRVLGADSGLA